jgi:hypothetical protein
MPFLSTGKLNFDLFANGTLRIAEVWRRKDPYTNHEQDAAIIELSPEETARLRALLDSCPKTMSGSRS